MDPFAKSASHLLKSLSLVLVIALLVPDSPTHAQMRICRSRSTDSHDQERLRAAIQKVLPEDVPIQGIPEVCRNRGAADAWFSTSPRLKQDGATEWWDVKCVRGARQWACQVPAHRQLVSVSAEVDGIPRRLQVSFDDMTGLARARAFALQTMKITQDLTAATPRVCEGQTSAEDERAWKKAQREYRLAPHDTVVELSVESDDAGGFDVITNGGEGPIGLRFRDTGDESLSQLVCWAEWVIVT